MTLHKHWSVPAYADEVPAPVEVAAPAPAITRVWVAEWEREDEGTTIRIFFTEDGCRKWRQEIARDNWNTGEEPPEDAEEMADAYFDFNDDDEFSYHHQRIRS